MLEDLGLTFATMVRDACSSRTPGAFLNVLAKLESGPRPRRFRRAGIAQDSQSKWAGLLRAAPALALSRTEINAAMDDRPSGGETPSVGGVKATSP